MRHGNNFSSLFLFIWNKKKNGNNDSDKKNNINNTKQYPFFLMS